MFIGRYTNVDRLCLQFICHIRVQVHVPGVITYPVRSPEYDI